MSSDDNAFQYAGEIFNETTGLQYLRARWYDPIIGRFIQEDTYAGELDDPLSLNLYTYVENNPLKYVDSSGHNPWLIYLGARIAIKDLTPVVKTAGKKLVNKL